MAKFQFETLNPVDRDSLELEDGTLVEFRNRTEFSAAEQVEAQKLQDAIGNLMDKARKAPNEKVYERLEAKQREFMGLILPESPDGLLEKMTAGQLGLLAEWWNEQQTARFKDNGRYPNGRGRA